MRIISEPPGEAFKKLRQKAGISIEALAELVDVSPRYLYRIENEGKKPGYDVTYRLIHALGASADTVFYPDKIADGSEVEELLRMLYDCDQRSLEIVKGVIKVLIRIASSSP